MDSPCEDLFRAMWWNLPAILAQYRGGTRTLKTVRSVDFESTAFAIPPLRHIQFFGAGRTRQEGQFTRRRREVNRLSVSPFLFSESAGRRAPHRRSEPAGGRPGLEGLLQIAVRGDGDKRRPPAMVPWPPAAPSEPMSCLISAPARRSLGSVRSDTKNRSP